MHILVDLELIGRQVGDAKSVEQELYSETEPPDKKRLQLEISSWTVVEYWDVPEGRQQWFGSWCYYF